MASPFEGAVLDPVKCSKLSMEERREIVYELANWSHGAAEMMKTWSRQDILQILCSEMGKERKYTGLTKLKIIEHLLKVVSVKKSMDHNGGGLEQSFSLSGTHKASKRPRKADNPSRLPAPTINVSTANCDVGLDSVTYCKNAACKARLSREDSFCKRCSCCICRNYDDNKDPSLWLTCNSEPPFLGDSCNMSCHLECALKHQSSGIARKGVVAQLDGSFYCVSCGKMNDLMSCWRKQLIVAKETRRVDILCYRISLSQKLLAGTKKYEEISEIVDDAVKQLEAEVGTLTGAPVKKARGIVNRLSSGQEVQRLCASAIDSFDLIISSTQMHQVSDSNMIMPNIIRVEDISSTSVTVILGPNTSENVSYTLWHWKANEVKKEAPEPTCTLATPQTKFIVSCLSPATEYIFKVSSFNNVKELSSSEIRVTTHFSADRSHSSPATNSSLLSNPSSVEDESNNFNSSTEPWNSTNTSQDQNPSCASDEEDHTVVNRSIDNTLKPKNSSEVQVGEAISTDNGSDNLEKSGWVSQPGVGLETSLPITPCRLESSKDGPAKVGSKPHHKNQNDSGSGKCGEERSSLKKRCLETQDEEDGLSGGNLEYYIKVIRWLECEGHIDKEFRQKFLTWYTIRATPQETRIVKAFVDTLIEDPASLSEQLVDTFGEIVSSKRSSEVPLGFCLKLWH